MKAKNYTQPIGWGKENKNIKFRGLQVEDRTVKLYDPTKQKTYNQTEIEDCLDGYTFFKALTDAIESYGKSTTRYSKFVIKLSLYFVYPILNAAVPVTF